MKWVDDRTIDLGDTTIELVDGPAMFTRRSSEDHLVMIKTRRAAERLIARAGERPIRCMVEIGIYQGGSTVLYQQRFRPAKLVALERNPEPCAALETWIARHELAPSVRTCYGINQGDRAALEEVLAREIGEELLDLVIDDASHRLHETRTSFGVLFPRLVPGGLYVIEDWGWAHWPDPEWQNGDNAFAGRPALSNLVVEIVLTCASRPGAIDEVILDRDAAYVRRGSEPVEAPLDTRRSYLARGRLWSPL